MGRQTVRVQSWAVSVRAHVHVRFPCVTQFINELLDIRANLEDKIEVNIATGQGL